MQDPDPIEPDFIPPVNPLPPVVIALALVMVLVEGALSLAEAGFVGGPTGIGWRIAALQDYGISTRVLDVLLVQGIGDFDLTKRFITYAFINGSFTQALFGVVLLLALGKFVGEAFGNIATLIVFIGGTVFGAVIFCLLASGNSPLFGAYPPVYALIGAYTYQIWLRLGQTGHSQLQAFRLIGFLLALQLGFGLIFGGGQMWIADLAGFVFGFVVATVLVPGGWAALLARMRDRP